MENLHHSNGRQETLEQVLRELRETISSEINDESIMDRLKETIDATTTKLAALLQDDGKQNTDRNPSKLTPPQVARLWGVSHDKVLAWIRSGELQAINTAAKLGGRPQYIIDADEITAFEQRRAVLAPPPPCRRTKRDTDDGVIQFF